VESDHDVFNGFDVESELDVDISNTFG
jgi:hypothetical protein